MELVSVLLYMVSNLVNSSNANLVWGIPLMLVVTFGLGAINGLKNIPVDEPRERINEVEKEKPVYLICIFRKNCASIPIQAEQSLAD